MRIFLLLSVVLAGCASGTVRATSDVTGARFTFDRRGNPIEVRGIDVYEMDGDNRGKTVCELNRVSTAGHDVLSLRSWVYGRDVGTTYAVHSCSPLVRGRDYGINVFHHNCMSYTRFKVSGGGEVLDLGPNEVSCYM